MSIKQFLAMGGYAWYVWLAYGAVFAVLGFNVVLSYYQRAQIKRRLQRIKRYES